MVRTWPWYDIEWPWGVFRRRLRVENWKFLFELTFCCYFNWSLIFGRKLPYLTLYKTTVTRKIEYIFIFYVSTSLQSAFLMMTASLVTKRRNKNVFKLRSYRCFVFYKNIQWLPKFLFNIYISFFRFPLMVTRSK